MRKRSVGSGADAALLLKVLREANGELVASKVLKEAVGPKWREALAQVRRSYTVDEVIGGSGNHSFRLNMDAMPLQYLTEPAPLPPVPMSKHLQDKTVRITLTADDIRALLRGTVPPTARDSLVGGLMRLTEETT